MCVCVTFVVCTYCKSCTRPISTNPRSMEAGEYELTWDVFRRAVSRWSRSPSCCGFVVCFGWGGFSYFLQYFFFETTRPAASMRPPCLIHLSTSSYATLSRNVIMPLWFKCYYSAVIIFPCRVVDYRLLLLAAVDHSPLTTVDV